MANIHFDQVIDAEQRAAYEAAQRASRVKAECGALIVQSLPESAVANVGQAMLARTLHISRGATEEEAASLSGLSDADLFAAEAGRVWITAMQAECRAVIIDGRDPDWPPCPPEAAALAKRF